MKAPIPLIDAAKIDALLPQTQCGRCGYPGCMPYAEAIAQGDADINRCPPGGDEVIRDLAELLGVAYKPLAEGLAAAAPSVAFIDESLCIGCTLCLQACPVDAIAGAPKQMHTVIESACTGCELCVEPCPVACISMRALPERIQTREERRAAADGLRARYNFCTRRIADEKRRKAEKLAQKSKPQNEAPQADAQALINAALARIKAQAAATKPQNIENLTPAQQAQIDEIEARRARARDKDKP